MTGSRDPMRVYIERQRQIERRRRGWVILTFLAYLISAGIMAGVLWIMLTVVFAVYGLPA